MLSFEARVDALALMAFDTYVSCRENLYKIQVDDEKRRMHMLLRRTNLLPTAEENLDLPDWRGNREET
jgi:hypothetical protein